MTSNGTIYRVVCPKCGRKGRVDEDIILDRLPPNQVGSIENLLNRIPEDSDIVGVDIVLEHGCRKCGGEKEGPCRILTLRKGDLELTSGISG